MIRRKKDETVTPEADVADVEETTEADAVEETVAEEETTEETEAEQTTDATAAPGTNWARVIAFGVLPALALLLGAAAGYLKWQDNSVRNAEVVRVETTQIAKDSTIAILSYKPETVEQQLGAARDLLTGEFKDSYTSLTTDVVIPGSKQKQISAVANVPAVASVSADEKHAVVLVFVNQTVTVGQDPPTATASSVRVGLDKVGDRWLISEFDPV